MKRISISLLMLALLAPASGWADELPPPHDPRAAHAATDRDHNGEIDRDEFEQRMIHIFYFADVDRDGFVTIGQLMVFDEKLLFQSADVDNDSRISLSEFLIVRFEDFREADTDGSDTLSVKEVVEEFNE
ncbi:MAG: EF-hand domain-containing protein [Deltaproteobacteria bacterium]|nr:EF-hand domain-containing protein [Deltaproteobacteria bacterium]